MSCEIISDPQLFGGAPFFMCGSSTLCKNCGLPDDVGGITTRDFGVTGICYVCAMLLGDRATALRLARDAKFRLGPFCQFCESDEQTVLCDWPEMKPTEKRTELAEVGDVWITQKKRHRSRIVEIENLNKSREVVIFEDYGRRIWVLIPKHPKPYPYDYCNHNGTFATETLGTCDRQCCWRHQREVGEDRHYCFAHWDSWQGGMMA